VLFAYILGPVVFGWYGLFLGPLLLVLVVHLARIVLPELVRGESPTPDAVGVDPIPDSYPTGRTESDPTRSSADANGSPAAEDAENTASRGEREVSDVPDESDGSGTGGEGTSDPSA
jgi:hypothetical protein